MEEVHNFKSITGTGLKGEINENTFYIGNEALFNDNNLFKDENIPREKIRRLEKEGKTTVLLGNKQEIMGLIILMDRIRDDAGKTVRFLQRNGIKTVMLTGDNQGTAHGVASQLGMDECYHDSCQKTKWKRLMNWSKSMDMWQW